MTTTIFVSPHFDDICFSLGGMLPAFRADRKLLINIYTHSGWMSNREMLATLENLTEDERNDTIDRMRDEEDDAFASFFAFEKQNLACLDANLIVPHGNKSPAQFYDGMEMECENVYDRLSSVLLPQLDRDAEVIFIAPLGIGQHRNHLVTYDVMLRFMSDKFENASLTFYEDLPYSVEEHKRQARFAQVREHLTHAGYDRYAFPMDDVCYQRKLSHVTKYKSQMNRSLEEYAVRTAELPVRHEALWCPPSLNLNQLFN